jgi:7-carboxy-7-deazaguanine synthase
MRVFKIFNSIDGEINHRGQGCFSTFIRLASCNLSCHYCDTKESQPEDSGKEISVDHIIDEVESIGCKNITITGGEPLLQEKELKVLCQKLWHMGYNMSVETNGTLQPTGLYGVSSWIVDYKLPGSGMEYQMLPDETFEGLTANDFVKFVITDIKDFTTAVRKYKKWRDSGLRAKVAFSPCGKNMTQALFVWMQERCLFDIILNIQIHKLVDLE